MNTKPRFLKRTWTCLGPDCEAQVWPPESWSLPGNVGPFCSPDCAHAYEAQQNKEEEK